MNTLLAALALVIPLAGCEIYTGQNPNGPKQPPATCAELFAIQQVQVDGLYTLYAANDEGRPWIAYCANSESAEPKEYLPLPHGLEAVNESGAFGEKDPILTTFLMLPIDPSSFHLTPTDHRFSKSSPETASLAFGTAIANGGAAWSAIDLRGTPFAVLPDQFVVTGKATVTPSERDQVIEIEASADGAVTPRDGFLGLTYIGTSLPADEAAAVEAGVAITDNP